MKIITQKKQIESLSEWTAEEIAKQKVDIEFIQNNIKDIKENFDRQFSMLAGCDSETKRSLKDIKTSYTVNLIISIILGAALLISFICR